MEDLMIRIDNVKKKYKLGQIGGTTLREELQRKVAKARGKDDPTAKIGAKQYSREEFWALNGISFDVLINRALRLTYLSILIGCHAFYSSFSIISMILSICSCCEASMSYI